MTTRIVLAGPESTGKSELTRRLADVFKWPSAQEYARIYLEKNGPAYDYALLLALSRGHRAHQQSCVPIHAPWGFFDTDMINYKIWCDVVYGRCHEEIVQAMHAETSHTYLLCYPDLPWEDDPLRENPHDREMLFARHVREIEALGRDYHVIRGHGEARLAAARHAVQLIMGQRQPTPPGPGNRTAPHT